MIWYDIFVGCSWVDTGGSSTVHIYTQTIHRTTQSTQTIHWTTQLTNWEECRLCPVFASYTLAFALQLRKEQGKTSVRVAGECQLARWKQNIQNTCSTILPSLSMSTISLFPSGFLTKTLHAFLISIHLTFLELIAVIIFGEEYKSRSSP